MVNKLIYRISINPITESQLFSDYILYDKDDYSSTIIQIPNDCVQTGFFQNINDVKDVIEKADIIFSLGDIDILASIEIGLALSLGKTIFFVTTNKDKTIKNLNIPYLDSMKVNFVTPNEINKLIN